MFRKYLILCKRLFLIFGLQHPNATPDPPDELSVKFDGSKFTELGDKIDSIVELLSSKQDILSDRLQEALL